MQNFEILHMSQDYTNQTTLCSQEYYSTEIIVLIGWMLFWLQMFCHTPSDINNLLSAILLDQKNSNQKIWAACFVTKFQNCKFLGMFKDKQLTVSRHWSITFWYPEDGPLPDIESRVVHDSELNGQKVFPYETAGFTEHPAKYLKSSDNKSSTVLLKNPVFQIQNA